MKAVSALLSSRAMASICASVSASAFSTTPVGFPVKGSRVNAVNLMNLDLTRHRSSPAVCALAGNSSPGRDHSAAALRQCVQY